MGKITVTLDSGDSLREVGVEIPGVMEGGHERWVEVLKREMNRAYRIGVADGIGEGIISHIESGAEFEKKLRG